MELTVKDRVAILNFSFPASSGLVEQILIKSIIKKIEFTPEEVKQFGLADKSDGTVTWDAKKGVPVQVDLSEEEIDYLAKIVNQMDEAKQINQSNLDTCLKFHKQKTSDNE